MYCDAHKQVLILAILLCNNLFSNAQKTSTKSTFSLLFYNTENYYDVFDDPETSDNDFLPGSKYHWTKKRFEAKKENLYRAIISSGISPPAIIGLAEIENNFVLKQLAENTPFEKYNYKIIQFNSPDIRGIDVAILYQSNLFKPIIHKPIRIQFPASKERKTRDILYVKGIAENTDTLHIFINHWPSRRGGQEESNGYRNYVAGVLRNQVDSIVNTNKYSKIIIMGDFNDEPDNESITLTLKAGYSSDTPIYNRLTNLSRKWLANVSNIGTHKFKGKWGILDQIIVSGCLLDKQANGFKCNENSARIINTPFLLMDDNAYQGLKPFRTYNGFQYLGGFSDHLPVILELNK